MKYNFLSKALLCCALLGGYANQLHADSLALNFEEVKALPGKKKTITVLYNYVKDSKKGLNKAYFRFKYNPNTITILPDNFAVGPMLANVSSDTVKTGVDASIGADVCDLFVGALTNVDPLLNESSTGVLCTFEVEVNSNADVTANDFDFSIIASEQSAFDTGQVNIPLTVTGAPFDVISLYEAQADNVNELGYTPLEDKELTITAADLLKNDKHFDANGQLIANRATTITSVTAITANAGNVVLNGDKIVYTPAVDFLGEFKFSYEATTSTEAGSVKSSAEVTLNVTGVNQAPTFNLNALDDVTESNVPVYKEFQLATNITDGDSNKEQGFTFTVSSVGTESAFTLEQAFSVLPTIDNAGVLSYTLHPYANGVFTFKATLKDNGGVDNGGVDTTEKEFTIKITPVNNAPEFKLYDGYTGELACKEDSGENTIKGFLTNVMPGPAGAIDEKDQTLKIDTDAALGSELFSVLPSFVIKDDGTADVTFTPKENAHGIALINFIVNDSEGGSKGGGFNLHILEVNDEVVIDESKIILSPSSITDIKDTSTDITATFAAGAFSDLADRDSLLVKYRWQYKTNGDWQDFTDASGSHSSSPSGDAFTVTLPGSKRTQVEYGNSSNYQVRLYTEIQEIHPGVPEPIITTYKGKKLTAVVGNALPEVTNHTQDKNSLKEGEIVTFSITAKDSSDTEASGVKSVVWKVVRTIDNEKKVIATETDSDATSGTTAKTSNFKWTTDNNTQIHANTASYEVVAEITDGLGGKTEYKFTDKPTVTDVNSTPEIGETKVVLTPTSNTAVGEGFGINDKITLSVTKGATDKDEEDVELTYLVQWLKNGEVLGEPIVYLKDIILEKQFVKGDKITAHVWAKDTSTVENNITKAVPSESTINVINTAPTQTIDLASATTTEKANLVLTNAQLITDAIDADSDTLKVTLVDSQVTVAGVFKGTLTLSENGDVTFAPGTDFIGLGENESVDVSFKFTLSDSDATAEGTLERTQTIRITGINDIPQFDATKMSITPKSIQSKDDVTQEIKATFYKDAIIDVDGDAMNLAGEWQYQIADKGWVKLIDASQITPVNANETAYSGNSKFEVTLAGSDREAAKVAVNAANASNYKVRLLITADDAHGTAPSYGGEALNVVVGNALPEVTTPSQDKSSLKEGEAVTFSITAKDSSDTEASGIKRVDWKVFRTIGAEIKEIFTETDSVATEGTTAKTSKFKWTTDNNTQIHANTATYEVVAEIYDGLGGKVEHRFNNTLTISDVNIAPEINATAITIVEKSKSSVGGFFGVKDSLGLTVDKKATDADSEDYTVESDNLLYYIQWYKGNVALGKKILWQGTELVLSEGFAKGDVISAKVWVEDGANVSSGINASAQKITVINTAPEGSEFVEASLSVTEKSITITNSTLITGVTDADSGDLARLKVTKVSPKVKVISSSVNSLINKELGSVTVDAKGNVTFNLGKDFDALAKGERAEVDLAFTLSDTDTNKEGLLNRIQKIMINGANDTPEARITTFITKDAAGNKVSSSKPDTIATITAKVSVRDIDFNDIVKVSGNWKLVRERAEVAIVPVSGQTLDVTNSADRTVEDITIDVAAFNQETLLKDDKVILELEVVDNNSAKVNVIKTITLGNPPWFPAVDLKSHKLPSVLLADGTYQVSMSNGAITALVTLSVSDKKSEISAADFQSAKWSTPVKGFISKANVENEVTINSIKHYVNGKFVSLEVMNNSVDVDDYEAPVAAEFVAAKADGSAVQFDFSVAVAAGYTYKFMRDGVVLETASINATADADGAVSTDYTVNFKRTVELEGAYSLEVEVFNPKGKSVSALSETVDVIDSFKPTDPPVVDDIKIISPTNGQQIATVVGTDKLEILFSWEAVKDAVQYGVCILNNAGNVVLNQLVGASTSKTIALAPGSYSWNVIAWNKAGYSKWSKESKFVISSPDVEIVKIIDPSSLDISLEEGGNVININVANESNVVADLYVYTPNFSKVIYLENCNLPRVTLPSAIDATQRYDLMIRRRVNGEVSEWTIVENFIK